MELSGMEEFAGMERGHSGGGGIGGDWYSGGGGIGAGWHSGGGVALWVILLHRTLRAPSRFTVLDVGAARLHTHAKSFMCA